uniref:Uncharacterized protein n=1 Tax=Anopheles farauti TaxID=69004 RepID=A0A182QA54_9DIPT
MYRIGSMLSSINPRQIDSSCRLSIVHSSTVVLKTSSREAPSRRNSSTDPPNPRQIAHSGPSRAVGNSRTSCARSLFPIRDASIKRRKFATVLAYPFGRKRSAPTVEVLSTTNASSRDSSVPSSTVTCFISVAVYGVAVARLLSPTTTPLLEPDFKQGSTTGLFTSDDKETEFAQCAFISGLNLNCSQCRQNGAPCELLCC